MSFIRKNHRDIVPADVPEWNFEIGAVLTQPSSNAPQLLWTQIGNGRGGFGTVADPGRASLNQVALNSTDRFPSEDFGMVLQQIPFSASAQVLHCRLNGLATITVTPAAWTVSGTTVIGDDTVFDLNIAAGTSAASLCTLKFTNTKRTAASATNTGCRGIYIRAPGIALDDPAVFMPYIAAAYEPFTYLRYMIPLNSWTDYYTRLPADRATPTHKPNWVGYSTNQTVSMEECVLGANELGKSLWVNIPMAANDDLIREWAVLIRDTLAPGKYCIFEYNNETWNLFSSNSAWLNTQSLNEVNGYVFQYCYSKYVSTISRTAGVVTATFTLPDGHGCAVGDVIYTNSMTILGTSTLATSNGYKTITSVTSPLVCTWTDSPAGADIALSKVDGQFRSGPLLVSATRAGTVLTVVVGKDHGLTAGVSTIKAVGFTGYLAGGVQIPVVSTPTARSFTVACTAGANGDVLLNGGSVIVGNFTNELNSYDQAADQHAIRFRWVARRAKQMSDIVADVFGADFGVRAKIALMNQAGNTQWDQLTFVNTVLGPPSTFFHGIGVGNYQTLNASGWPSEGGVNLRDLTTYNGNTPPAKQDYADMWEITATHVKDSSGPGASNYDGTAMTARWYGLEMWQYEWNFEASSSSGIDIPGAAGTAAGLQKNDTLNDPILLPAFNAFLDSIEHNGFTKSTLYNPGTCPVGSPLYTRAWSIFRDLNNPTDSSRFNALVARNSATRSGPIRSLLSATVPTTIDGRAILGVWPYPSYSGAFPPVVTGTGNFQNWIISCTESGNFSFEPTFNLSSGGTRNIVIWVNGVALAPNYSIPIGTNTAAARTIALTKGLNIIRTTAGTSNPGLLVTAISFLFTPVP